MLIKDVLIDSRRWVEYVGFLPCACKVPRGYSRFPLQPALGRGFEHKTKLNISHHMLTSSTQLQNRSFHVVERTRTFSKCQKMKNARAKRVKMLFFHCQIFKFVGFLLPSCSLLYVRVVVKTAKNLVILFYYFVDDGTELFFKCTACCTSSMIIFSHWTNEILSLCRCRSRC